MILQLILCLIAGTVAWGLYKRRNMWPLIVLYWVVLTVKCITDLVKMVY